MKTLSLLLVLFCFLFITVQAQVDSIKAPTRTGYDQQEFTFVNEYNRMLMKFLRAIDEVKDGYYKSDLTWKSTGQGSITSLMPYVDNSLFTGQSMLRTLNNERESLTRLAYDENSQRLAKMFLQAVENAQEGVDEILKYYATPWKIQREVQAADVQKKGGWTKAWEAMRDMVTKTRYFLSSLGQSDSPKFPYVEAKVVTDLLPPVVVLPATPPGAPFFGFWYKVSSAPIVVAEPLTVGTNLYIGDVILGVYTFGSSGTLTDADFDPSSGAERSFIETPSIVAFSKIFNERKSLAGKTVRLLVRREGKEKKIDIRCTPAEGGNIFQR